MTPTSAAPAMEGRSPPRWVRHRLDERGCLLDDFICIGCHYNLHGLPWNGQCPECGKTVGDSLRSDGLCLSDRAWLGELVKGLNVILVGLALGVIMAIALAVILILLIGPAFVSPLVEMMVWGMAMPPGLVLAWGIWRLTAPEPGTGVRGWAMARGIARWAAMLTTALALLTGPVFLTLHLAMPPTISIWNSGKNVNSDDLEMPIAHIVTLFPIGVGGASVVVFGFAMLLFAGSLAMRGQRRTLVIHTGVVGVMCLLLCVFALLGLMSPLLGLAGVILAVLGFFLWVLLGVTTAFYTLILVFSYRHMLDTIAQRPISTRV